MSDQGPKCAVCFCLLTYAGYCHRCGCKYAGYCHRSGCNRDAA